MTANTERRAQGRARKRSLSGGFKYPEFTQDKKNKQPIKYTFNLSAPEYNPRALPIKGYRLRKENGQVSDVLVKFTTGCMLIRPTGASGLVPVAGVK